MCVDESRYLIGGPGFSAVVKGNEESKVLGLFGGGEGVSYLCFRVGVWPDVQGKAVDVSCFCRCDIIGPRLLCI